MRRQPLYKLLDQDSLFKLPAFKKAFVNQHIKRVTLRVNSPFYLYLGKGSLWLIEPELDQSGVEVEFKDELSTQMFSADLDDDLRHLGLGMLWNIDEKVLSFY